MSLNNKDLTPVIVDGKEFEFNKPDVSVSTSGRFVTHDVIGGVTVRQKVGEDPIEIEVSGVCTTEEANFIDNLHRGDIISFSSHRRDAAECQVASTSTDPYEQGGAVRSSTGDWTHNFTLNLVEVE